MEEGELEPSSAQANDPAYEWPGTTSDFNVGPSDSYAAAWRSDTHSPILSEATVSLPDPGSTSRGPNLASRSTNDSCLRFVVIQSGILPAKHKVAMADGYPDLQFGRDAAPTGSSTPRVRLKEMEVSKVHASVYWDGARKEWGIVDMGSKHGTFVKHSPQGNDHNMIDPHDVGARLSPPRMASMPRMLRHLDQLTIGSTTFLVHLHKAPPCDICSPGSGEEIPLFPTPKRSHSLKQPRSGERSDPARVPAPPRSDPRAALSMLKRSLLTRHNSPTPASASSSRSGSPVSASKAYVDRSARRRALQSASQHDAPGVPSINVALPSFVNRAHHPTGSVSEPISPRALTPDIPVSQPPAPLPNTNVGYRLLMGQGWEPGTALGTAHDNTSALEGWTALVEPLELASSTNRAGLGMSPIDQKPGERPNSAPDREREKFRRWQENRFHSFG
ncbi:hypothetical protein BDN71DRAFT_1445693 [Pleurotus eryngii]|uniref:Uncharacterized protein n=1 Tax=Pleurotus eryngii TaxID=5323 RepID=A0A9P5ZYS7_PLEER|nr:hypothetical protein BDN71DRAFT_1445693 [Pleurotus eryngii]